MLAGELKELLAAMPDTARVVVVISANVRYDGTLTELEDPRDADVSGVERDRAEVVIRLEE